MEPPSVSSHPKESIVTQMMILSSTFMVFYLHGAFQRVPGILLPDLKLEYHESTLALSWMATMYNVFTNGFGLFSGIAVKRFGSRRVVLVGSLICTASYAVSYFRSHFYILYFTIGLLPGIGSNMSVVASIVCTQYYFHERRGMATGNAVAGYALGMCTIGPLLTFFKMTYGWRGSCLLVGGLAAQGIICGALLREHPQHTANRISHIFFKKTTSNRTLYDECETSCGREIESEDKVSKSVHDCETSPFAKQPNPEPSRKEASIWKRFKWIVKCLGLCIEDRRLYTETRCLANWLANICFTFGPANIFVYIIDYARNFGLAPMNASFLLLLMGLSFFISQCFLSFLVDKGPNVLFILYGGSFVHCASLIIPFIWYNSELAFQLFCLGYGIGVGCFYFTCVVMLTELTGLEYMEEAVGLMHISWAIGSLLCIPVTASIFQHTHSYALAFSLDGIIQGAGAVAVLVTFISHRRKKNYTPF